MNVHNFVDEGLGHSSYLIYLGDGTAALVDPPRFPTDHITLADRLGARLTFTFDTHSHADYITGSRGLSARYNITFVAPAASRLATPHHPVCDDDRVDLSESITLTAIASWLGWLIDASQPIVFILDPNQNRDALVRQASTSDMSTSSGNSPVVSKHGTQPVCRSAPSRSSSRTRSRRAWSMYAKPLNSQPGIYRPR